MGDTVLVFASRLCGLNGSLPRPRRILHHLKRVISAAIHPVRVIPPAQAAARIEPTATGGSGTGGDAMTRHAAVQAAANDREEPQ
jgi:hypothetical protein